MADPEKKETPAPEKQDTPPVSEQNDVDDKTPENQGSEDLTDLKEEVVDEYLKLFGKNKWGLMAVMARTGANKLSPSTWLSKKYLLKDTPANPKDIDPWQKVMDTLVDNATPQVNSKKGPLSYDQKDLAAMRAILAKSDKTQLEALLLSMREEGKDPTKEGIPPSPDKPNTPPVAPIVGAWAVVAGAWIWIWAGSTELHDEVDKKAEGVDKYFTLLSDSSNVSIKNTEAKKNIESMLLPCTFFGKTLTVNKYIIPKLEQVEEEIRSAGIKYAVTDVWGYNWRNVSWWKSVSYHALWLALDINPKNNPFIMTKRPYIPTNMPKEFVDIFKKNGFIRWWDRWNKDRKTGSKFKTDAMHFQFADEAYLQEQMQKDNGNKIAA